jgi:uncharacterized protein DUF1360
MDEQRSVGVAQSPESSARTSERSRARPPASPEVAPAPAPAPADAAEPIAGYVALASTFLGLTCAGMIWLRRTKLLLPRPTALDVALMGLATARLSRLITRDKVMRPLRAPFTVAEHGPPGEAKERARGSGLIRAAGELITCPRCTAMWVAGGLSLTYFASPRVGRFVGVLLSSSLISDYTNRKFALLNEAPPSR